MGTQIITQPQTFKTDSTVMGLGAGLSATTGLTLYGNLSATGGLSAANVTIKGNLSASGDVFAKNSTFTGNISAAGSLSATNITVKGNLSASGNVFANDGTFTGQILFADGTVTAPAIANSGDTNNGIYFPATDTLGFVTLGSERLRIADTGNVGVGTTTPNEKLTVAGNISASNILFASQLNLSGDINITGNLVGANVEPTGPVASLAKTVVHNSPMAIFVHKNQQVTIAGSPSYLVDNTSIDFGPEQQQVVPFWTDSDTNYFTDNPDVTIVDLQTSTVAAMALLSNGTVWVNGLNANNQLSVGSEVATGAYTYGFKQVYSSGIPLTGVRAISMNSYYNAAAYDTFAAITDTNNLYLWGYNGSGQCGTGNTNAVTTPTLVSSLAGIVSRVLISGEPTESGGAKRSSTVAVTTTGLAYACGYNGFGQLAQGNTTNQTSFVQMKTGAGTPITGVTDIGDGSWTGCSNIFLIAGGQVWGAGDGGYGQLGRNSTTDSTYLVQAIDVLFNGLNSKTVTKLKLTGLYGNGCSVIATTSDNQVFTWGTNAKGQLGQGDTTVRLVPTKVSQSTTFTSSIVDIQASSNSSSAGALGILLADGTLYVAGYDVFSKRGVFAASNTTTFSPVNTPHVKAFVFYSASNSNSGVIMLTESGKVYGFGVTANNILGVGSSNSGTPRLLIG